MWLGLKEKEMKSVASTPVLEKADPAMYATHRFGLSHARWESLAGKRVWVTGAGSGFGRSIATTLAAAKCRVFLTGRQKEKLTETLREMKHLGIDSSLCQILPADLRQEKDIQETAHQIGQNSGGFLGLIHCAALPIYDTKAPFQHMSQDVWNDMMKVNVTAAWLLVKQMFQTPQKTMRVVLLTSEAGWAFTSGFGPYNVSKAALNNLGASLAEEYAHSFPKTDVQINVLDPGEARSEMNPASSISPYASISMMLALMSHPDGGPNGRFFHRDGRHLAFAYSQPYDKSLLL
jgi:NAD(P)-dependent dehydrogenase (short-subunit alcohol dehydrogenase family)